MVRVRRVGITASLVLVGLGIGGGAPSSPLGVAKATRWYIMFDTCCYLLKKALLSSVPLGGSGRTSSLAVFTGD